MKIKFPKTDRLIGLSAMIISILTLIIFIYQTNIINTQSKLSVKPRLSLSSIESTKDSIVIFEEAIQNKGLGPAIVKKASIEYKGETFPLDFDEFISRKFPEHEKYVDLLQTSGISENSTILQNETITIYKMEIPMSKLSEVVKYFEVDLENMEPSWNFELVYSSLYEDETWKANE